MQSMIRVQSFSPRPQFNNFSHATVPLIIITIVEVSFFLTVYTVYLCFSPQLIMSFTLSHSLTYFFFFFYFPLFLLFLFTTSLSFILMLIFSFPFFIVFCSFKFFSLKILTVDSPFSAGVGPNPNFGYTSFDREDAILTWPFLWPPLFPVFTGEEQLVELGK